MMQDPEFRGRVDAFGAAMEAEADTAKGEERDGPAAASPSSSKKAKKKKKAAAAAAAAAAAPKSARADAGADLLRRLLWTMPSSARSGTLRRQER